MLGGRKSVTAAIAAMANAPRARDVNCVDMTSSGSGNEVERRRMCGDPSLLPFWDAARGLHVYRSLERARDDASFLRVADRKGLRHRSATRHQVELRHVCTGC